MVYPSGGMWRLIPECKDGFYVLMGVGQNVNMFKHETDWSYLKSKLFCYLENNVISQDILCI